VKRFVLFVALTVFAFGGLALASPRSAAQEADIDRALEAVDLSLVALAHTGNDAADRGDWEAAVKAYASVHERAPAVSAITRRLGMAEAHTGNTAAGTPHCREALAADPSPENHAALASALVLASFLTVDDANEAMTEARAAVAGAPDAEFAQLALCAVAAASRDVPTLDACTAKLRQIAPTAGETHLYASLAALGHEDYDGAQRELAAARAAGLNGASTNAMELRIDQAHPRAQWAQQAAVYVGAAFVGALFVLFVVGMLLSDGAEKATRGGRSLYGMILMASAIFYYVFVVVLAAVMLLTTVAIVSIFVEMTSPARYVEVVGGIVSLYVIVAIVRASLAQVPNPRAHRVDFAKEPALKKALDAIAKETGERSIAELYVRPDAVIQLVEQGGALGHFRKKSRRTLFVGAFALDGLSRRAFEALVAHEMARFRGTLGRAVAQREALDALADRMYARGVRTGANPVWWIVGSYRLMFNRISEGAVALQETLADEQAATLYGAAALLEGLKHLLEREIEVEAETNDIVCEVTLGKGEHGPDKEKPSVDKAWLEYAERERHIESLDDVGLVDGSAEGGTSQASVDGSADGGTSQAPVDGSADGGTSQASVDGSADGGTSKLAWTLFESREALEREMREHLRGLVSEELGLEAAPTP
jgi:hypothetical protein